MQYHQQLFGHDPANGVYGDCYRTVIACLLDLNPEAVPHVCDGIADDALGSEWSSAMNAFLAAHGLRHVEFPLSAETLDDALTWGAAYFGEVRYTLCGKSSGGEMNHIVVCKGNGIEHSTNSSTLVGPCTNDGHWWIGGLAKCV